MPSNRSIDLYPRCKFSTLFPRRNLTHGTIHHQSCHPPLALLGNNGKVGTAVFFSLLKAHKGGKINLVILHREGSDLTKRFFVEPAPPDVSLPPLFPTTMTLTFIPAVPTEPDLDLIYLSLHLSMPQQPEIVQYSEEQCQSDLKTPYAICAAVYAKCAESEWERGVL
ncbi:hypothetical protein IAR55_000430 [Kwoniella newhampshirensis]|uniref:Thioester reductase (TE) domain-containing protein n=1 Tax=Kwoniella newhampshirensis TaxID=1651941 RepID=A0AAW0Z6L1_9TREE